MWRRRQVLLLTILAITSTPTLVAAQTAALRLPKFRRHVLNDTSAFSACTVFDVDHDGDLDIFSGGFWYEAPDWKRHTVREVENIRGRFDDYSNLPLDVNGDGWMDVISVNYRSQSLYWVEHPGATLGVWKKHVIDTPGSSETGRLADVDGDGDLDVLPNGTKFSGWWELRSRQTKQWVRHALPEELAAHGIGFGDIDGDGRGDLICPNGWAAAPSDRRAGRWLFHREFQLHRDGSIPILVQDVDEDGDNDIVWGRGHNIGLYWLEQQKQRSGKRDWKFHVIDSSWSQPHSLLWGDVNGDGQDDLIAGKRYRGHDGKDPGETDPLAVYWYSFNKRSQTWNRGLISSGAQAGFDLDPEAIDIDGDGDLDIVGAAQSGLFLFENRLAQGEFLTDDQSQAESEDVWNRQDMLANVVDAERPQLDNRESWGELRAKFLARFQTVLGPVPDSTQRTPLELKIKSEEVTEHFVRHRVSYSTMPGFRVAAWLLIPKKSQRPAPAVLCLPAAAIERSTQQQPAAVVAADYAAELAQRGFVCLVPDDYEFVDDKRVQDVNLFQSRVMKKVWTAIRSIDALEAMPEVHRDRIGILGHAQGGQVALFTACFDQRLRFVVASGSCSTLASFSPAAKQAWQLAVTQFGQSQQPPFDFHEVLATLAPRPVYLVAPADDAYFKVDGVAEIAQATRPVYELFGKPDALQVVHPQTPHGFRPADRQAAFDWLEKVAR